MNTKEEIFPLYVGRCKVRNGGIDWSYLGIAPEDSLQGKLGLMLDRADSHIKASLFDLTDIDDCQLILKPLRALMPEDYLEMAGYVFNLKLPNETAIALRDFISNADTLHITHKSVNKINQWLREHSYALDDNWFKGDNPIAIEP